MDILTAVMLGVAIVWLVSQEFGRSSTPVPPGIPALTATILGAIIGVDWFFGHRAILGHQKGILHTAVKIGLLTLVVISLGSGLTAIRMSLNVAAALFNVVWVAALAAQTSRHVIPRCKSA